MIIDADAHVIEADATWDYLEPHEQKYRPIALTGAGDVKHWLVDGQLFSREAGNHKLPIAVRQMADLKTRAEILIAPKTPAGSRGTPGPPRRRYRSLPE